jgi:hypothetical protein
MSFLACCALQGLCSGASCIFNCCGKTAALHHGVRIVYFVFFLLTALLAWLLSAFGADWLRGYARLSDLLGPMSAYNITFAFVVFHFLFGLAVIGVRDAHSARGAIHNGWWGPKFVLWLGMTVGFLFLPQGFWSVYPYISLVGSVLFTLVQLFMLVDFAHSWNESWVAKYHETQNRNWFRLLLGATVLLLLVVLVGTILMFVFLHPEGCPYSGLNTGLIAGNLGLVVLCCALSVLPAIQERNVRASLLTAAVVCLYATYLTAAAIFSQPVPLLLNVSPPNTVAPAVCWYLGQSNDVTTAAGYVTLVLGALITFVAVAFSSMRAGSHAGSAPPASTEKSALLTVNRDANDGSSSDEEKKDKPATREEEQQRALEQQDRELLNLDDAAAVAGGELASEPVAYSYSWFHLAMLLGGMYMGCLLTNWSLGVHVVRGGISSNVDKSIIAVYLKAASSWVVCLLYIWTLVAPIVLPNRDFGQ